MANVKKCVFNLKSEILCRSAEDDFFYFYKVNSAYKKLKEAVSLTPNHFKSLVLLADVSFIKGFIKKALDLYLKAEKLNNSNVKVLAAIANCYNSLGNFSNALVYCNKVIDLFDTHNYTLFSQVFEMKINILMSLKRYKPAFDTLKSAENFFDHSFLKALYNINYEILNEKIILQKKLQKSNLKIV